MHRFFIEPNLLSHTELPIRLPDKIAHQARDVLHLTIGEQLVLLDNSGDEYLARITKTGRDAVEVSIEERLTRKGESNIRLILCQGLLKSARFEWILEKGTELGVSTFIPTLCRRSMAGLEEAGPSKLQRWQRIVQEATEQCGRTRLPQLLPIRPLIHALNDLPTGSLALMPWEEEHNLSLRSALQALRAATSSEGVQTVVLFIGPEGGLLPEEVQLAQHHGVQPVSLGTRILRAETAALSAVANILYELEKF